MKPYQKYISSIVKDHPSLSGLSKFLQRPSAERQDSRGAQIWSIDANVDNDTTTTKHTNSDSLVIKIRQLKSNHSQNVAGLVILLESPGPPVIEDLGSELNINPFFFAGYVSTSYVSVGEEPVAPLWALYPSQAISSEFLHIHFQRLISLGESTTFQQADRKGLLSAPVPRTVRRTQSLSGQELGLVRACHAVYLKTLQNGKWLASAIVMFDSDVHDIAFKQAPNCKASLTIHQMPRRIVPESTRSPPDYESYSNDSAAPGSNQLSNIERMSLLYDKFATDFTTSSPSMLALAYPAIRTALADWRLYTLAMDRYVPHYEYSMSAFAQQQKNSNTLDNDIKELHLWRRRCQQSLHKLNMLRVPVEHWRAQEKTESERWSHLVQDIDFIISELKQIWQSLEALANIAANLAQLLEAQRSIAEAGNVRHLTYVALLFVPMSFIASLFSMNGDYAPGKPHFWVYWVTAVPVLLIVLIMFRKSTAFLDVVGVRSLLTRIREGVGVLPIMDLVARDRRTSESRNTII